MVPSYESCREEEGWTQECELEEIWYEIKTCSKACRHFDIIKALSEPRKMQRLRMARICVHGGFLRIEMVGQDWRTNFISR